MTIDKFIKIIQSRSDEHAIAISRLYDLPGSMISIIRQELDSMIRVLYLLSVDDLTERERLMNLTLSGNKWNRIKNNKISNITDADMVKVADKYQGWSRSVYKFGCAFIHLSNFHGYNNENPFNTLSEIEKISILTHMRHYHGGPITDNPTFDELAIYLPSVFEKIKGNLECYLESLIAQEHVDDIL